MKKLSTEKKHKLRKNGNLKAIAKVVKKNLKSSENFQQKLQKSEKNGLPFNESTKLKENSVSSFAVQNSLPSASAHSPATR